MAKVSVIIPIYNVEKYLRKCLDSVINQTLKDIEIICVDDCSTDSSLSILKEYASIDNRIIIIEQNINQGQGIARNVALDIVKSEYISFIDPDDWVELNMLETMCNQAIKLNSDVVQIDIYKYFEENNKFKKTPTLYELINSTERKTCDFDNEIVLSSEMQKNTALISHQYAYARLYKTSFLKENNIKFSNIRCYEDVPFGAKVFLNAKSISYNNNKLYYYRIRSTSLLRSFNNKIDCLLASIEEIYNYLIDNSLFEEYETNFKNFIIYSSSVNLLFKDLFLSRFYIYFKLRKYLNLQERFFFIRKLFKYLFSIKKTKKHRIFTVFGLKIKIKNKI